MVDLPVHRFHRPIHREGTPAPPPCMKGNSYVLQRCISQHEVSGNRNAFCKVHSAKSGGRVGNLSPSENLWLVDYLPWAGDTCIHSGHRSRVKKAWPVEAARAAVMPTWVSTRGKGWRCVAHQAPIRRKICMLNPKDQKQELTELTERLHQIVDLAEISLNIVREIYDSLPPF